MLRLQCKPFQVGLGFYQDIFRLFIGVQGSICVQDFSTLKWLRVISPMSLHFHLESPGGSKPSELDFTIGRDFSPKLKHVDPLNLPLELNVDKTSLLALHYAVTKMLNNLWGPRPKLDRVLKWRSNRSRALRKLRYVIENRTGRVVWFGQHASPESVRLVFDPIPQILRVTLHHSLVSHTHSKITNILRITHYYHRILQTQVRLEPGSTRAYSLWHTTATQNRGKYALLRFALETEEQKPSSWSEAIEIDRSGLNSLRLGLENKYAVAMNIRVHRCGLSTRIVILGSHEVHNDTNFSLDLEWTSTTTIVVRTPGRGRTPSKDDVSLAAPCRVERLSLKSRARDWIPCVSLDKGETFGSLRFKFTSSSSSWCDESYVIPGMERLAPFPSTPLTPSSSSTPRSLRKGESVTKETTPATPRRVSDLQDIEQNTEWKLDVRYVRCVSPADDDVTYYFGLVTRLVTEEESVVREQERSDSSLWLSSDSEEMSAEKKSRGNEEEKEDEDQSSLKAKNNLSTSSLREKKVKTTSGWWRVVMSPLLRVYNDTNSQVRVILMSSGKIVSIRAIDSEKDTIESKQSVSFSFDPQSVKDGLELRVLLVHEKNDLNFTPGLSLLSKNNEVENEDIREHIELQTENAALKIGAEYHTV